MQPCNGRSRSSEAGRAVDGVLGGRCVEDRGLPAREGGADAAQISERRDQLFIALSRVAARIEICLLEQLHWAQMERGYGWTLVLFAGVHSLVTTHGARGAFIAGKGTERVGVLAACDGNPPTQTTVQTQVFG